MSYRLARREAALPEGLAILGTVVDRISQDAVSQLRGAPMHGVPSVVSVTVELDPHLACGAGGGQPSPDLGRGPLTGAASLSQLAHPSLAGDVVRLEQMAQALAEIEARHEGKMFGRSDYGGLRNAIETIFLAALSVHRLRLMPPTTSA